MLRILLIVTALWGTTLTAQEAPMTAERMAEIVLALDPDANLTPNGIELTLDDVPVLVVLAPGADRMRALVPIASVEDVTEEELLRMMQANFDTALDGRYAVAQDRVWSVFIHPLSSLEREQFISGLAQTITSAGASRCGIRLNDIKVVLSDVTLNLCRDEL